MHRLQVRRALIIGRKSAPSLAWVPDAAPQHRSPGRRMLKHLARRAPTATPHLWSKMAAPVAAMSTGASDARTTHKHTNRLVNEESPYLLQHAHNPVDWHPWGEEAFAKAAAEDKLIFLSVGYATCHWCHVMERESFEDEATAALLNAHFVAVKVDREERPDVDRVYMTFVQATTGSGGWPMSVFLTPSLEPVYGGTYYPLQDIVQGGQMLRPSFKTVLRRLSDLWSGGRREELRQQGASVMAQLQEAVAPLPPEQESPADSIAAAAAEGLSRRRALGAAQADAAIAACARSLEGRYDSVHGGFGGAPKFPRPSEINLLLRASQRAALLGDGPEAQRSRSMAVHSLQKMAAGGMYDALGGGFARYSVDELWHVPHFEKMLYDNAQLAATYIGAFQLLLSTAAAEAAAGSQRPAAQAAAATAAAAAASASPAAAAAAAAASGSQALELARVARGVLDYLRRDMTHPEGGIYSAEDADSYDVEAKENREGAFYVWREAEIDAVLSGSAAAPGGGERGASSPPQQPYQSPPPLSSSSSSSPASASTALRTRLFKLYYNVRPGGNCVLSEMSDPHGEFVSKNVFIALAPLSQVAAEVGLSEELAAAELAECRRLLAAARSAQRQRPALDDKVVTAWNGLAISAFAAAGRALAAEDPPISEAAHPVDGVPPRTYLAAAEAVAGFLRRHLRDDDDGDATSATATATGGGGGGLRRSFCRGPSAVAAFADDYAYVVQGLLDLYEATGTLGWLQWAVQLQDKMVALFWDPGHGGFYSTSGDDRSIKLRIKDDYDGAEPAASSVAAANLLRLAALLPGGGGGSSGDATLPPAVAAAAAPLVVDTSAGRSGRVSGGDAYLALADATLAAFAERLREAPLAVPQLCCAAQLRTRWPLRQVIIAGALDAAEPAGPDAAAAAAAAVTAAETGPVDPSAPGTAAAGRSNGRDVSRLLDAVHSRFAPDKAVIIVDTRSTADIAFWAQHNPDAVQMVEQHAAAKGVTSLRELQPTAFVCQNYTCQSPTSDPARVAALLGAAAAGTAAAPRQPSGGRSGPRVTTTELKLGKPRPSPQ